jgi:16S rRNA (guanine(966)-N(2))-methyltransferase RsmD
MRVVGGSKRGTLLVEFDREAVRPTLDRIKESMFNIIQFEKMDAVVDLFSGTGQLGIEALSRGAGQAVFCDNAPGSLEIVRKNLKKTGLGDNARVLLCDYKRFLKYDADREYDVIFVDPPYHTGLSDRALKQIGQQPVLTKTGIVVIECARDEEKPAEEGNLILRRRYDYGTVSVLIYVRKDREDA